MHMHASWAWGEGAGGESSLGYACIMGMGGGGRRERGWRICRFGAQIQGGGPLYGAGAPAGLRLFACRVEGWGRSELQHCLI